MLKLVIMEDEEAHFHLMKRTIEKVIPGVSIKHFSEAHSCLAGVDSIAPDVVIADYRMPGMDGIEFLKTFKSRHANTPVIIITGQGDEQVAVQAMKLGASDYLVKAGDFFTLLPGTIQKVVREKKLQESLNKTEKRFKDLSECTSDWIWEMDINGRYTYSNPMLESILGYQPEKIVGLYFYDLYSEPEKASQRCAIFERMKDRSPASGVVAHIVHKDGHKVIVETNAVPIVNGHDELLGYRGITRDISRRTHNQRALKLSHRFLEIGNRNNEMPVLLRESLEEIKQFTGCPAAGIRILNEQGDIPYQAYSGFSREFYELESPLSIKTDQCMCSNVITQNIDPNLEFFTPYGSFYINGTSRFLANVAEDQKGARNMCNRFGYESIALLPIRLENQVVGLIHVAYQREDMIPLEDVEILETAAMGLGTAIQRVQTQEALRKAKEGLEQRVRERTFELALANENLKTEIEERTKAEKALYKSSEDLKRFAYSVVHDLKSPAIAIHGLSRLLQKKYGEIVDENGQTYCDQIVKACEHIATLVEKINHYIVSKEAPLEIEKISINKMLRIIKDEFSARLTVREIEWIEPHMSVEIHADQLSFIRALRNLVDNTLKYGGTNLSRIRIGYDSTEQFHILSVTDNGLGIKPENKEKIFELFERNAGSRGIEGAGLGLNIVREVAHRHGGEVRVSSEPGKKTVFYLTIAKDLALPMG